MQELFPIPIDEQIACVDRELIFRRRVYTRRVADRKMSRETANKEISRMEAVRDSLLWMKDNAHDPA